MKRNVQLLNGWWDYRIGDGKWEKKQVPYSDLAVGFATCRSTFDAAKSGKRAFLVFDGITYGATVTLNGNVLGDMRPYSEYRFEITDILQKTDNLLSVEVRDLPEIFGPSEGWENYSGIIRDVYIEYTDRNILETVFWHERVTDDLQSATATVEIALEKKSSGDCVAMVTLQDKKHRVVHTENAIFQNQKSTISFPVAYPDLWSPDTPDLYILTVELFADGRVCDTYETRVGFKHWVTKGRHFYLNGQKTFLLGVCRHDMFGDQGHIVTEAQMRADMQMIKETGANYVRLVHYPHHKRVLEIADELGLFVSCEPGLWWSDMSERENVNGSLEVLRRTVIRDRNHISVAFWLSFNECRYTRDYLLASAAVCRENDPYHMVSGANCLDVHRAKEEFTACELDFYTMHPYAPDTKKMLESAEVLCDKPLVFTEWGGYYVYDNPNTFRTFAETIVDLWHAVDEEKPTLAGAALWAWAGMYEFNRAAPACFEGVLCEGLVDQYRRPTLCYPLYRECFAQLAAKKTVLSRMSKTAFTLPDGDYQPVSLADMAATEAQAAAYDRMMAVSALPISRFQSRHRNLRHMHKGPTIPEEHKSLGDLPVALLQKPLAADAEAPLEISVDMRAASIYLIGNVSMPKGHPIESPYGERVATLTLCYKDGTAVQIPLRNGYEITTAAGWYGPSRIHPVAVHAPRAMHIIHDMDREHYVINLYTVPADPQKTLLNVRISDITEGYHLLYYGLTVRKA